MVVKPVFSPAPPIRLPPWEIRPAATRAQVRERIAHHNPLTNAGNCYRTGARRERIHTNLVVVDRQTRIGDELSRTAGILLRGETATIVLSDAVPHGDARRVEGVDAPTRIPHDCPKTAGRLLTASICSGSAGNGTAFPR